MHDLSLIGEGGEGAGKEVTARIAQDMSLASQTPLYQNNDHDFDDQGTAVGRV
jgi:hypothetical protein